MTPDEQEALSIKHCTASIVRLTSGNFALFAPWSNADGMSLITIGPYDELESLIPSFAELSSWHQGMDHRAVYDVDEARGLLEKLGLARPKQTFERRI